MTATGIRATECCTVESDIFSIIIGVLLTAMIMLKYVYHLTCTKLEAPANSEVHRSAHIWFLSMELYY